MKEFDVFISYCRKDIKKAKRIKEEIENSTSLKCWMDIEGIESGSQFEDVIISAIDNARFVLLLLSENSMQSKWTKNEVRYAYETHKKVIPLNIDRCTPSGWFLFRFAGYDVIDYNDSDQKKKMLEDLVNWAAGNSVEKELSPNPEPTKGSTRRFYDVFWISQFLVFGLILLIMLSLFFFGLLTMPEGNIALRYNIILCICLCLTLYSLYLLSVKQQKKAFYFICILDVLEIIFLCALSQRINGYALLTGYHYRSFPYVQLNGLGAEMVHRGDFLVILLMELFAIIHISMLIGVLFIRIKGTRLWNRLR